MLKDYPEHIQTLQDDLNRYVEKPFRLMPFDGAIWLLEGALEAFISEARQELETAEASGDAEAIALAEAKASLMRRACSSNGGMLDLDDLWGYFQKNKEGFL